MSKIKDLHSINVILCKRDEKGRHALLCTTPQGEDIPFDFEDDSDFAREWNTNATLSMNLLVPMVEQATDETFIPVNGHPTFGNCYLSEDHPHFYKG